MVTNQPIITIHGYIKEIVHDNLLKDSIRESIKNSSYRRFADLDIKFGKRIGWYAIARAIKPKIVVKTGVDKGLGSIILCAAIKRNNEEGFAGKYFGTDINPKAGYLLSGPY